MFDPLVRLIWAGVICCALARSIQSSCGDNDEGDSTCLLQSRITLSKHLNHLPESNSSTHDESLASARPKTYVSDRDILCQVTSLKNPESASLCPATCPFLRPSDHLFCHFTCVPEQGCDDNSLLSGFADPQTHQCTACLVKGCKTCVGSARLCGVCADDYDFIDAETCLSKQRYFWWRFYIALAVILVFFIVYLSCLPCRPITNEHVLKQAFEHRSYTKLRMMSTLMKPRSQRAGHGVYPLKTNLMNTYISGAGVMLHFRWQFAMLIWSVVMLALTGLPTLVAALTGWPRDSSAIEVYPAFPQSLDVCAKEEHNFKLRLQVLESIYLIITITIYLVSFFLAILLAIKQRNFFKNEERRMVTMDDYALLVSSFPRDSGDIHLEEEYNSFFREAFSGVHIVGVSVVWNVHGENVGKVEKLMRNEIRSLDDAMATRGATVSGTATDPGTHTPVHAMATTGAASSRAAIEAGTRAGCFLEQCFLECVDNLFLRTCARCCASPCAGTRAPEKKVEPLELLRSLKSTGYVFLVFQSEEDKQRGLELARDTPLCFRERHYLQIQNSKLTPQSTLWSGHTVGAWSLMLRLSLECLSLVVLIILWTVLFYFPYAKYIMSSSDANGSFHIKMGQSILLSVLTVIGNFGVYQICMSFAEMSWFRSKDKRDAFYCVVYFAANLFNTGLAVWTVYLLAQGQSMDILQLKKAGDGSSIADQINHPSLRQSLYDQLFFYLWPGAMFFAFCFEPLILRAIPYYLSVHLIRSRTEIRRHDAELCLECPAFDLGRYIDILIPIVLTSFMMWLPTIRLSYIYAALAFSLMFVYAWDQYRFLRLTKRAEFDQDTMDRLVHWLIAFPCAVLSAAVVLRIHEAEGRDILGGDIVQKRNLAIQAAFAFAAHLLMHFAILKWCVPYLADGSAASPQSNKTYDEAATTEPCNWFNANAIHCLRSRHVYQHSPPCVPYVCGKEYLIQRNPDIGVFYEEQEVEQSAS